MIQVFNTLFSIGPEWGMFKISLIYPIRLVSIWNYWYGDVTSKSHQILLLTVRWRNLLSMKAMFFFNYEEHQLTEYEIWLIIKSFTKRLIYITRCCRFGEEGFNKNVIIQRFEFDYQIEVTAKSKRSQSRQREASILHTEHRPNSECCVNCK